MPPRPKRLKTSHSVSPPSSPKPNRAKNSESQTTKIPKEGSPSSPLPTPSLLSPHIRHSYAIGRGEQGVLTFEPYKSLLLPLWRFKTVPIATSSCAALMSAFHSYVERGDFVGADMSRKFVQMGMTRARRYANYKGGRKYRKREGEKVQLERSRGHEGREEKMAASEVFRRGWEVCRADGGYARLRGEWEREMKEWRKMGKEEGEGEDVGEVRVKSEEDSDGDD